MHLRGSVQNSHAEHLLYHNCDESLEIGCAPGRQAKQSFGWELSIGGLHLHLRLFFVTQLLPRCASECKDPEKKMYMYMSKATVGDFESSAGIRRCSQGHSSQSLVRNGKELGTRLRGRGGGESTARRTEIANGSSWPKPAFTNFQCEAQNNSALRIVS